MDVLRTPDERFADLPDFAYTPHYLDHDGLRQHYVDEGPRESTLEKLASLKPLVEGGRLTAALASQISDGAAAVLLASEEAVNKYNLKPRARIHHISARGDDPVMMLTGPIPATQYAAVE